MAGNGKLTKRDARTLIGAGALTAPPAVDEHAARTSVTESTMHRGSYRPSGSYVRLYTQAVANDDGTPLLEDTNALLHEIRDLLKELVAQGRE